MAAVVRHHHQTTLRTTRPENDAAVVGLDILDCLSMEGMEDMEGMDSDTEDTEDTDWDTAMGILSSVAWDMAP